MIRTRHPTWPRIQMSPLCSELQVSLQTHSWPRQGVVRQKSWSYSVVALGYLHVLFLLLFWQRQRFRSYRQQIISGLTRSHTKRNQIERCTTTGGFKYRILRHTLPPQTHRLLTLTIGVYCTTTAIHHCPTTKSKYVVYTARFPPHNRGGKPRILYAPILVSLTPSGPWSAWV